jgi:septal ring factor EnvC (AmiA/AmiB activator)
MEKIMEQIVAALQPLFDQLGDRIRAEFAPQFARIDARFAAIDKRFDRVDKRFDEVESQINTVREVLTKTLDRSSAHSDTLLDLTQRVRALEKRLEN